MAEEDVMHPCPIAFPVEKPPETYVGAESRCSGGLTAVIPFVSLAAAASHSEMSWTSVPAGQADAMPAWHGTVL